MNKLTVLTAASALAFTLCAAEEAVSASDTIAAEVETAVPRIGPVGPQVSARSASEAFRQRMLDMREAVAARPENEPFGTLLAPLTAPPPTPPASETTRNPYVIEELDLRLESPEALIEAFPPEDLVVGLNRLNTVTPATGFFSTTGEPAHINVGQGIFYTGNTFASFSPNSGLTWAERAFPAPLNAGDVMCCDQDLEYSQGRDHLFWSLLYINPAQTAGVVTIGVLSSPDAAPACLYDFTFGANVIPDYPHLGLSNDFLYLNVNNINTQGTTSQGDDTWVGSQMLRFPLDEMAACQSFSFLTFTWNGPSGSGPQRVFVPVEGATDVMYWGILDNNTTFRIFEWPESSGSITTVTKTIAMSAHNNPDCRGGANNLDWIERGTSFSITGFRMRGWVGQPNAGGGRHVVGWLWNASPTGSFTQAHIRAAVFDTQTKNLIGQPHIFNNDFCFGYPDVAPTERGHPAIVLGVGGQSGGGGSAVSAAILLGDDLANTGFGPFGPFTTVAAGTHNPANQRFGDYFTMQQLEPCDLYMTASSYVLNGGTAPANVDHHYVIFGRNRDRACFDTWNAPTTVPLPRIVRLPVGIFGP